MVLTIQYFINEHLFKKKDIRIKKKQKNKYQSKHKVSWSVSWNSVSKINEARKIIWTSE